MNADFPIPSPRQVRAIRAWFGLSQGEFADKCSVSLTTLVAYERGNRKPAPVTLELIARQSAEMNVRFNQSGAIVLPE